MVFINLGILLLFAGGGVEEGNKGGRCTRSNGLKKYSWKCPKSIKVDNQKGVKELDHWAHTKK